MASSHCCRFPNSVRSRSCACLPLAQCKAASPTGSGGADIEERVTCSDAQSYDDIAGDFGELLDHLQSLLRIAAALRFGDPASMQDIDPVLAEMAQKRAEIMQQGNADLKRMRRAGF